MTKGAQLELYAVPSLKAEGMVKSISLGKVTVNGSGGFDARVDPNQYESLRDDSRFTVQAVSRDLRTHALAEWVLRRGSGGAWSVSGNDGTSISVTARNVARDKSASTESASPQTTRNCTGGYAWAITPTATYTYLPLQKASTRDKSTAKYEFQTSSSAQFEALAGYNGANFYSIGLTGSVQDVWQAGVNFKFGKNAKQAAMVEWEYRLSKEYCFVINLVVETGNQKWVPYRFAGGNWKRDVGKIFTCNPQYKSAITSTTWVARTSSRAYSGYYQIAGVRIDAHQTNTTGNKMSYIPKSGKTVTMCGSDAKIANAAMVKEMA